MPIHFEDEAIAIIKQNAVFFIDSILQEVKYRSSCTYSVKPLFPIFGVANPEFYEQQHYEYVLNQNILVHLINNNISELFLLKKQFDKTVRFERSLKPPLAFIIEKNNQRIGYQYQLSEKDIEDESLINQYKLHHIEVFDWSGMDNTRQTHSEIDSRVQYVSIYRFMFEYFSEEIYTQYLRIVRNVIQKAKNIIGYQTISKLSLRHLWNFKKEVIEEIENYDFKHTQYSVFSDSGELTKEKESLLSEIDYKVLNRRFFEKKLYKSINGNEPFARCFMTSEYLYRTIKAGEEHYFDYSAIVTGYFKAIELLLHKIMDSTLEMKDHEYLWITCKSPKAPYNAAEYKMMNKCWHVRLKSEHRNEFKTEMGSLINFVEFRQYWQLNREGKTQIIKCLKNYNQGCRNLHLHKDIIEDIDSLNSVRDNTLLCLYYLIGGCKFADNEGDEGKVLGVADDSYDRLYRKLRTISASDYYLQLSESNEPIKTVRVIFAEYLDADQFDQQGNITSPIRFYIVNDFSDFHKITDESIIDFIDERKGTEKEILVCRENIPDRIWYSTNTDRVEIMW